MQPAAVPEAEAPEAEAPEAETPEAEVPEAAAANAAAPEAVAPDEATPETECNLRMRMAEYCELARTVRQRSREMRASVRSCLEELAGGRRATTTSTSTCREEAKRDTQENGCD